MTTPQDAGLPVVLVGDREFAIGPMTAFQLFAAKNLIVGIVIASRALQAKRTAVLMPLALQATQGAEEEIRRQVAAVTNREVADVDADAFNNARQQFLQIQLARLSEEEGYGTDYMGIFLEALTVLTEDQIIDLAQLVLNRYQYTHANKDFVRQNFNLEWFTEALAYFVGSNNIAAIVKNLQRLGTFTSMQLSTLPTAVPAA